MKVTPLVVILAATLAVSPATACPVATRTVVISGNNYVFVVRPGGYYYHPSFGYWHPVRGWWDGAARCWVDRDGNPPGPAGGPGTNWENPPGLRGRPGASPDRFGRCR